LDEKDDEYDCLLKNEEPDVENYQNIQQQKDDLLKEQQLLRQKMEKLEQIELLE